MSIVVHAHSWIWLWKLNHSWNNPSCTSTSRGEGKQRTKRGPRVSIIKLQSFCMHSHCIALLANDQLFKARCSEHWPLQSCPTLGRWTWTDGCLNISMSVSKSICAHDRCANICSECLQEYPMVHAFQVGFRFVTCTFNHRTHLLYKSNLTCVHRLKHRHVSCWSTAQIFLAQTE